MRWFVKAGVQTVWGVAMFAIAGYMLLFVYNQWAEYADGVRHWEAAACRAVDATVEPCDKATSDCKGFCVLMKVLYAVGASATAAKGRPVAIARSGECEFSTKATADAEATRIRALVAKKKDFACFAVPGDDSSVSEDDLTRSKAGKIGLFFSALFIAFALLIASCICGLSGAYSLHHGTRMFVRRCRGEPPQDEALVRGAAPAAPAPAAAAAGGGRPAAAALNARQIDRIIDKMATAEAAAGGGDAGNECSICLDASAAAEAGRVVLLPACDHYFHSACISSWLARGNKLCPVCRTDVLGLSGGAAVAV